LRWKENKFFFIIRIESHNINGRITLGQSIGMNDDDDNGQMTNKKLDYDKKLSRTSLNINDKSKMKNLVDEQIYKTSSNSNVFSRIMHSEPHVQ